MNTTLSDDQQKVIRALEDEKFKWRTVPGIAKSTNLDEATVRSMINQLASEGRVLKSSVDAADGSELFTTREHFKQNASVWSRLRSAFQNRAV
jgi:predicted transcriptional regulator